MASVFKRKGGKTFTAAWFDHEGKRVERSTETTDKRLAERIAQRWQDGATERKTGLIDPRIEAIAVQEARPLSDHLEEHAAYLDSKGTGEKQIDGVKGRIGRIIERAGAERIADLTPSSVLAAIQALRTPGVLTPDGISTQTATHYVRAIKGFSRWLVRDKRARVDALAHLAGFNAATDRRRVRRDLSAEELGRLIDAAAKSATVTVDRVSRDPETKELRTMAVRMTCPDRVWAYRIAAGSGFRVSEVSSLTPESFDLDGETPTVTVQAAHSKRRRRDVQPIRRDLAELLRPWLASKPLGEPVCPMPDGKAALVLRADLAAARATWIDEARTPAQRAEREQSDFLRAVDGAGRVIDFHARRHGYISQLVSSGASVKVAQELARHSTPTLTIGRYAHARMNDLTAALANVPGPTMTSPEAESMKATGTHGKPASEGPHLGPQLQGETVRSGASERIGARAHSKRGSDQNPLRFRGFGDSGRSNAKRGETPPAGLEPAACGLGNRRDSAEIKPETCMVPHLGPHQSAESTSADADLARVIAAWADLPAAIKAAMLALVDAGKGAKA